MNIHGYKKKLKRMTRMLREEENKTGEKRCPQKITRLREAKTNCADRIREIRSGKSQSTKGGKK